jgi:6-phosphogluconolactonase
VFRRFGTVEAGRIAKVSCAVAALVAPLLLTGCHNFFVCEGKASCPSGGGSGSGDYAYISNSTSGSTYLAAYDLSGGKLTAISGSPFSLGYVPVAMSVAPSNSFLYIATIPGAANPGIYLYTIGTTGGLSIANGGSLLVSDQVASMDISPDGGYLFAVSTSGLTLNEYSVDTSTGLISLATQFSIPGSAGCALQSGTNTPASQSCTVAVSPSGQYVVVALGTGGDAIFPYSSSSGITSPTYALISPVSTTSGDYSVAMDPNNYLYIARTNALAVYAITPGPVGTLKSNVTYSSGVVPRSVTLSTGSTYYVYTANEGASNVSGFSIGSTGALTQISGSPFAGPTSVSALGVDNTGGYMVTAGYNGSSGVQLFSIPSTGEIALVANAGSGTSTGYPAVMALTH